ncbi:MULTISPECIES: ethanolamine utilization protein EutH [Paenibacillus]|uniref:ethanolamine utilization protein EutH n=1 Tax=Paenibacillus TaxID=44249 RepID=UPI00201D37F0|nr:MULTISPECIES: ethanolamine utilization protein EutH [Paenibacillus]MCL6660946.1 ethanolamine utilization protein EutH [Paenibacillus amylolyticus]WJM06996.1 ethanolamine utilization protein EutH [Paenibacillus sp. PK1-4R]
MPINDVVMILIAFFLVLGALDKAFGNRLGLGAAFTEGIMAMGTLALVMVGIVSLAPFLANMLMPLISPLYEAIGADPASFANTILAVDMGGYALAGQMAQSEQAGLFSWVFLGTMFGPTIVFTIPVALGILDRKDHPYFAKGVLIGISTIPVGCLVGGLVAGINFTVIYRNLMIPILLSVIIMIGLRYFTNQTVRLFKIFGSGITLLSLIGLVAIAVKTLTGWALIPNMAPLSEGITTVGTIAIVLAGAFPMVAVINKVCQTPLERAGRLLNLDAPTTAGLVASLAHNIPTFRMVKNMNPRGKVISIAFAVSGSFVLGGHLGFVAGMDKSMVTAMIVGKLTGGISAAIVAAWATPIKNDIQI